MNFYIPSSIAVAAWFAAGLMVLGYTVKAYKESV